MENKKTNTLQELAEEYGVSTKTMYNWLQPIRKELLEMRNSEQKRLRIFIPKQVNRIREFLG
jgi:transcriptional antiterminator